MCIRKPPTLRLGKEQDAPVWLTMGITENRSGASEEPEGKKEDSWGAGCGFWQMLQG